MRLRKLNDTYADETYRQALERPRKFGPLAKPNLLHLVCARHNVTRADVAKQMGRSVGSVSNWRTAGRYPDHIERQLLAMLRLPPPAAPAEAKGPEELEVLDIEDETARAPVNGARPLVLAVMSADPETIDWLRKQAEFLKQSGRNLSVAVSGERPRR